MRRAWIKTWEGGTGVFFVTLRVQVRWPILRGCSWFSRREVIPK